MHSKSFAIFRLFLSQSLRKKKELFFLNIVYLKLFIWAHWKILATLAQIVSKNPKKFCSDSKKFRNKHFFSKERFLSRRSPALIENSFAKTYKIYFLKIKNNKKGQRTSRKDSEKSFSLGIYNMQFRSAARKFFANKKFFSH